MKPLGLLIPKEILVTRGKNDYIFFSVNITVICIQELGQDQLIRSKHGPMSSSHGARFENIEQNQGSTLKPACHKRQVKCDAS